MIFRTPLSYTSAVVFLLACSTDTPVTAEDVSVTDAAATPTAVLGAACRVAADCISGVCLKSEYGPPFCSRSCDTEGQPCEPGADTPNQAKSLCVSYEEPPTPRTPEFKGDLKMFCVPRCVDEDACEANNPNWESCDVPKWLGDPIYPSLGNLTVCLAPSYQGKDPVDPATCDWEKTITPQFNSEANLCRSYCNYLDKCKELPTDVDMACCQWGCFNRMVQDGLKNDAWYDQVKCHLDVHAAYPDVAQQNSCSQPPIECCPSSSGCPDFPEDPTPPAATP